MWVYFFVILWLSRSSMKNPNPPPMSGLSLLSYPSRRLFRMCVTSLSYTLGVSTHVLFDTSSSSSVWKELWGRERIKKKSACNLWFPVKGGQAVSLRVCSAFLLWRHVTWETRDTAREKCFDVLSPWSGDYLFINFQGFSSPRHCTTVCD